MERWLLVAIGLLFAAIAFRWGGVEPQEWVLALVASGAILALSGIRRGQPILRPNRVLLGCAVALVSWSFIQALPLPPQLVQLISPARYAYYLHTREMTVPGTWTSLSLFPAESFRWAVTVLALSGWFLLGRWLVYQFSPVPWRVVVPFLVVAVAQAVLGLVQVYAVGAPLAQGTYVNRNHFAGLLELAFPLLVTGGLTAYWSRRHRREAPLAPALFAGLILGAAALVVIAVVLSLSRGGFAAILFSALLMGVAAATRTLSGKWRAVALMLAAVAVVSGFLYLPTDALIRRFAALAETEELSADTRLQIWKDTIRMIRAYLWTGCGLGAYQSALMPFCRTAPMNTVNFAHNDWLQLLAEWGLIGFALWLVLVVRCFQAAVAASHSPQFSTRMLGLGCFGALAAIALHSLVDFNLYVPANAMFVVWIASVAEGIRPRWSRLRPWMPGVLEPKFGGR